MYVHLSNALALQCLPNVEPSLRQRYFLDRKISDTVAGLIFLIQRLGKRIKPPQEDLSRIGPKRPLTHSPGSQFSRSIIVQPMLVFLQNSIFYLASCEVLFFLLLTILRHFSIPIHSGLKQGVRWGVAKIWLQTQF